MKKSYYLKSAILILCALAALVIYYPAMSGGFVFDDYNEVADNPAIKSGFAAAVSKNPFRSIPAITYRLDYLIGGPSAVTNHVSNLIFHFLAAIILALFWRSALLWAEVGKENAFWIGAITGIFFLLHPLNVEAVAYISARADLLAAIFTFLGLLLTLRGFDRVKTSNRSTLPFYFAGLASFGAALLCKESAIAGPILAMGIYLIVRLKDKSRSGQTSLVHHAHLLFITPYVLLMALWSALRLAHKIDWGKAAQASDSNRWLVPLWAMGKYVRLMLWPYGLSIDHGAGPVNISELAGPAIIGAILLLSAFVALYYIWKSPERVGSVLGYAVIWLTTAVLVVTVFPLADPVGEPRVYLAMGAWAFMPCAALLKSADCRRIPAVVCLLLISILWALTSGIYASKWASQKPLWSNAVRFAPSNARAWYGLGSNMLGEGNLRLAKMALEESLKIDPSLSKPESDLGVIAMQQGDAKLAARHFEKAIEKNNADWRALTNLAVLEEQMKDYRNAEDHLRRAIMINSRHYSIWFNLGNVYFDTRKYTDALDAYSRTLALNPDHIGARTNLAQVYEDMGDFRAALAELDKVLASTPDFKPAIMARERVISRLKSLEPK